MMLRDMREDEIASVFPDLADAAKDMVGLAGDDSSCVIVASPDRFDSEFLHKRIAWVREMRVPSLDRLSLIFERLFARLANAGYDHLLHRVHAANLPEIQSLERAGFQLIDVGVTFERQFTGPYVAPCYEDLVIRPATFDDAEHCVRVLAATDWNSRYEHDPDYRQEDIHALRAQWIRNSYAGRADLFLVGELEGRVAGFITGILDRANRVGKIELVGTAPGFRRRHIAARILAHVAAWFSTRADRLTVRTQATNYPAANLYESAGFLLKCTETICRRILKPVKETAS